MNAVLSMDTYGGTLLHMHNSHSVLSALICTGGPNRQIDVVVVEACFGEILRSPVWLCDW